MFSLFSVPDENVSTFPGYHSGQLLLLQLLEAFFIILMLHPRSNPIIIGLRRGGDSRNSGVVFSCFGSHLHLFLLATMLHFSLPFLLVLNLSCLGCCTLFLGALGIFDSNSSLYSTI
jgi:hypothetical protein